jgi:hypothetical protein
MFIPTDQKRHIYEGLTRHNYFPNQKDGARELPPCFSTLSFTPEIAELLATLPKNNDKARGNLGYDQVSYSVTRHNNVPRSLALIHPKAYSLLVKSIHDNWENLNYITENECSIIKPQQHIDGRMLVMNYEDVSTKVQSNLKSSFGKRFRVDSDIASCFHSIYSHSIPWAILGFDEAKKQLRSKGTNHWSDDIDLFLRRSKRGETQGIAIGPGTSSVIAEIVLGAVDKRLCEIGFKFKRYIDDYICFCETYEHAQRFIQILAKELSIYKLNINLLKTKIVELPEPSSDYWVTELTSSFPVGFIDSEKNQRKLTIIEITHFLDTAVKLNKKTPDGSVIKYAVSSILRYVEPYLASAVLDYVINLAWHYPILIPLLDSLLASDGVDAGLYEEQLNTIVAENARNLRSDGMAWPLYFIKKHNLSVTTEAFAETLKSKDCVAILCLYAIGAVDSLIVDFANNLMCKTLYEKDQYWLLLYQLYRDGRIAEPYGDGVFDVLKNNDVNFLPAEGHQNLAQKYCDYLNNPFASLIEGDIKSFKEWKASLK